MASAAALPIKTLTAVAATGAVVGAAKMEVWKVIMKMYTGPDKYARILATLYILVNIKNMPGMWLYRVFKGIYQHLLFSPPRIPPSDRPPLLFLPVITTTYVPLTEIDHNLHKSNSTYYSDLDVTRSHLVCALLQPGMRALQNNAKSKLVLDAAGNPVKGKWGIMLGGVHCSFKREIKPLQRYEMWSRLLCWDRKWLYVVTHFVKKGTVRPKGYVLGDGSLFGGKKYSIQGDVAATSAVEADDIDEKAIFASAVSKYVIKLGRLTIHPEVTIAASGYLPEGKPGGWGLGSTPVSGTSGISTPEVVSAASEVVESEEKKEEGKEGEKPMWKKIMEENERGLEIARHFAALDELHGAFTGSKQAALGKFTELI
ncbi:hypothetical protein F5884DRAFT_840313 [Xylogone sp. PMI_703]|nr:hypothetical protein F5884DRAFT_840313 [Xylogone sp. PMI_703]